MEKLMNKMIAETMGTFSLIFFGCGTIIFMGSSVGHLGISFAFGLTVVGVAYSLGSISGAHLNPAVSLAAYLSGRMSFGEMFQYWIAQIIGGALGALVLQIMSGDISPAATVIGSSGLFAAFTFELVATFLFVTIILGATREGPTNIFAGLVIGLTLVAVHLAGISISGASVNPARSLATNALNPLIMGDLWVYILAPMLGGGLAGLAHKLIFSDVN